MLTTALIFDFDGLILDTETPELTAWETIYSEYGQVFPVTDWGLIVGSTDAYDFEPMSHLETLVGRDLDRAEIQRRHRADTMARNCRQ